MASKKTIPTTLKNVLKDYFGGCAASDLPDPTKLKTVLWRVPDCDIACGEVWACGQAFEFPELTSDAIEHDQTGTCDFESVTYARRSPSRMIDVGNLSHDLYWRAGRANEIKAMMENGDVDVWVLQTYADDGSTESWVFRGFPVSLGKTTTETRSSDPAMLPLEIAVDGRVEIVENLQISTCGAGDIVTTTKAGS